MKEYIIRIPEADEEFVASVIEKFGYELEEIKKSKKSTATKKKKTEVSPTFLFGKWKGLNLDARKIRNTAWDRSHKF